MKNFRHNNKIISLEGILEVEGKIIESTYQQNYQKRTDFTGLILFTYENSAGSRIESEAFENKADAQEWIDSTLDDIEYELDD